VKAGGDFAKLAGQYSDDPQREEWWRTGWIGRGRTVPELRKLLFPS